MNARRVFEIFLGVLTAFGGFVDMGDLVANAAHEVEHRPFADRRDAAHHRREVRHGPRVS